uniref:Uncharacterized protein n=1 Tax=Anguilla anguilla TaxID=7936 RepID=A0A0E9XCA0_ANGAN
MSYFRMQLPVYFDFPSLGSFVRKIQILLFYGLPRVVINFKCFIALRTPTEVLALELTGLGTLLWFGCSSTKTPWTGTLRDLPGINPSHTPGEQTWH